MLEPKSLTVKEIYEKMSKFEKLKFNFHQFTHLFNFDFNPKIKINGGVRYLPYKYELFSMQNPRFYISIDNKHTRFWFNFNYVQIWKLCIDFN